MIDNPSGNIHNVTVKKKVRLVISKSADFQDVRCECGALLYRELRKSESVNRVIEIKCRKCGKVHSS